MFHIRPKPSSPFNPRKRLIPRGSPPEKKKKNTTNRPMHDLVVPRDASAGKGREKRR